MRAVVVHRQGTPVHENVAFEKDWPDTQPGPDEVLIRTEASALNHLDLWVGRGLPGIDLEYPRIGGSDACGRIEQVGEGVDESWVGRRVILNAAIPHRSRQRPGETAPSQIAQLELIGEHHHGVHREQFTAPVSQIVEVDESVQSTDAAAFGLVFLTAWRCLVSRAGLRHGQTVLITGIGGGVATAGLAISTHFGCRTIVTSRHEWKLKRACELGAADGVLDTGGDWSREVRGLTAGEAGVDIALDSIGKKTHLPCIKSLAQGGTYVTPGATTGPDATTDLARIFWNQLRIIGSTMGDMREFNEVVSLLNSGHLRPVVDRVYDAEQGPEAWKRLEESEQFGKLVIRWV